MTTTAPLAFPAGVLFFPVTAFDAAGEVDAATTAAHIAAGVEAGAAGVFAACGTGEFHALGAGEYGAVLAVARDAVAGRVPLVGGVGGPLGHARACARLAAEHGAEALLVLPPYLVGGTQAGLVAYVRAILDAAELPVILYHRGTAQFTLDSVTELLVDPRVVGIKDGVGDVALMQQFVLRARELGRDDVTFFNGLLTAEMSQGAYRAIGVDRYSSAVFAMAPEIALAYYAAYAAHDEAGQAHWLREFYGPLVRLRDTTPGYAVSLIKAGLRLGGAAVGSVRAPLVDPSPAHEDELARLLAHGRALAAPDAAAGAAPVTAGS